jgi:hypothetical protein
MYILFIRILQANTFRRGRGKALCAAIAMVRHKLVIGCTKKIQGQWSALEKSDIRVTGVSVMQAEQIFVL